MSRQLQHLSQTSRQATADFIRATKRMASLIDYYNANGLSVELGAVPADKTVGGQSPQELLDQLTLANTAAALMLDIGAPGKGPLGTDPLNRNNTAAYVKKLGI